MRSSVVSFLTLAFALFVAEIADAAPVKILPDNFVGAKQPQIAIDPQGRIFIAFGKENSIYLTSSADDGKTFQPPTQIGTVEKLALGMRRGPRIIAGEKFVSISAISHADGNLYSWTSENSQGNWASAMRVNNAVASAREGLHAMVAKGDLAYSVWLDLRNKRTQLWGARSNNGGKSWEPNVQIYESPDQTICECCHPSVAIGDDGSIVVMWRNWLGGNRDMYQSRSEDGGKTFAAATKLGTGSWALKGCPMDGGNLILSSNRAISTWRRESKLFVTTMDSPEVLLSASGTQPIVARAKSGFTFLWQNGGNLFQKNGFDGKSDLFARNASYASAAWSPKLERSFVVWESDSTILCAPLE